MNVKEQYLEATKIHRRVTRILYDASPEIQPWNGDPFTFDEVAKWSYGWGETNRLNKVALAFNSAKLALAEVGKELNLELV